MCAYLVYLYGHPSGDDEAVEGGNPWVLRTMGWDNPRTPMHHRARARTFERPRWETSRHIQKPSIPLGVFLI